MGSPQTHMANIQEEMIVEEVIEERPQTRRKEDRRQRTTTPSSDSQVPLINFDELRLSIPTIIHPEIDNLNDIFDELLIAGDLIHEEVQQISADSAAAAPHDLIPSQLANSEPSATSVSLTPISERTEPDSSSNATTINSKTRSQLEEAASKTLSSLTANLAIQAMPPIVIRRGLVVQHIPGLAIIPQESAHNAFVKSGNVGLVVLKHTSSKDSGRSGREEEMRRGDAAIKHWKDAKALPKTTRRSVSTESSVPSYDYLLKKFVSSHEPMETDDYIASISDEGRLRESAVPRISDENIDDYQRTRTEMESYAVEPTTTKKRTGGRRVSIDLPSFENPFKKERQVEAIDLSVGSESDTTKTTIYTIKSPQDASMKSSRTSVSDDIVSGKSTTATKTPGKLKETVVICSTDLIPLYFSPVSQPDLSTKSFTMSEHRAGSNSEDYCTVCDVGIQVSLQTLSDSMISQAEKLVPAAWVADTGRLISRSSMHRGKTINAIVQTDPDHQRVTASLEFKRGQGGSKSQAVIGQRLSVEVHESYTILPKDRQLRHDPRGKTVAAKEDSSSGKEPVNESRSDKGTQKQLDNPDQCYPCTFNSHQDHSPTTGDHVCAANRPQDEEPVSQTSSYAEKQTDVYDYGYGFARKYPADRQWGNDVEGFSLDSTVVGKGRLIPQNHASYTILPKGGQLNDQTKISNVNGEDPVINANVSHPIGTESNQPSRSDKGTQKQLDDFHDSYTLSFNSQPDNSPKTSDNDSQLLPNNTNSSYYSEQTSVFNYCHFPRKRHTVTGKKPVEATTLDSPVQTPAGDTTQAETVKWHIRKSVSDNGTDKGSQAHVSFENDGDSLSPSMGEVTNQQVDRATSTMKKPKRFHDKISLVSVQSQPARVAVMAIRNLSSRGLQMCSFSQQFDKSCVAITMEKRDGRTSIAVQTGDSLSENSTSLELDIKRSSAEESQETFMEQRQCAGELQLNGSGVGDDVSEGEAVMAGTSGRVRVGENRRFQVVPRDVPQSKEDGQRRILTFSVQHPDKLTKSCGQKELGEVTQPVNYQDYLRFLSCSPCDQLGGSRRHRQHQSFMSMSTDTSDSSLSEGEIRRKCIGLGGSGIGCGKSVPSAVRFFKRHPKSLIKYELGDMNFQLRRQKIINTNWRSYYIAQADSSGSGNASFSGVWNKSK